MDIEEIKREITRLEGMPTTYANCEKLAMLYCVRDGVRAQEEEHLPPHGYSFTAEPASEFVEAAKAAPLDDFLNIMDEHMDAIREIYPKEYSLILRRIRDI